MELEVKLGMELEQWWAYESVKKLELQLDFLWGTKLAQWLGPALDRASARGLGENLVCRLASG